MLMSHAGRQTRRAATAAPGPRSSIHITHGPAVTASPAPLRLHHTIRVWRARGRWASDSHKQSKNVTTGCWRNLVRTSPCVGEHAATAPCGSEPPRFFRDPSRTHCYRRVSRNISAPQLRNIHIYCPPKDDAEAVCCNAAGGRKTSQTCFLSSRQKYR